MYSVFIIVFGTSGVLYLTSILSINHTNVRVHVDTRNKLHMRRNEDWVNLKAIADIKLEIVKVIVNQTLQNRGVFDTHNRSYFKCLEEQKDDKCASYRLDGKLKRLSIPNVWGDHTWYKEDDITLVTQLSADRLHILDLLLDYWPGPVSAAVYVELKDLSSLPKVIVQHLSLLTRDNVDLHIVLKAGV